MAQCCLKCHIKYQFIGISEWWTPLKQGLWVGGWPGSGHSIVVFCLDQFTRGLNLDLSGGQLVVYPEGALLVETLPWMDNGEKNTYLHCISFVPGTQMRPLSLIYIFTHLIFLTIWWVGTDYPHFTNEENGAQRGYVTWAKKWNPDWSQVIWLPEFAQAHIHWVTDAI